MKKYYGSTNGSCTPLCCWQLGCGSQTGWFRWNQNVLQKCGFSEEHFNLNITAKRLLVEISTG
jgi:hypothetical protein